MTCFALSFFSEHSLYAIRYYTAGCQTGIEHNIITTDSTADFGAHMVVSKWDTLFQKRVRVFFPM
jgi:hypothetical protein